MFFCVALLVILIDEVILDLQTYRLSSQENLEMNEFSLIAICGIFNQRNQIFGGSAGKQCTCISLYSTMPSEMKETGKWKSSNLDLILVCGNKVYEDLALNRILGVEDLPRKVKLDRKNCSGYVAYGQCNWFSWSKNQWIHEDF